MATADSLFPGLTARDHDWLTHFLGNGEDVRALAQRTDSTLIDLLAWLTLPAVRRVLAAWEQATRRTRELRDEADRRVAVEALRTALATSPDPVEKRRAASAILRALASAAPARALRSAEAPHPRGVAGPAPAVPVRATPAPPPPSPSAPAFPSPRTISPVPQAITLSSDLAVPAPPMAPRMTSAAARLASAAGALARVDSS